MCIYTYEYIYVCVCIVVVLNHVWFFVTTGAIDHRAPLSMGFPRQEYCSGLPYPSPGDLPDTGIEPASLASPALAGRFFTNEPPGKPYMCTWICIHVCVYIRRRPWHPTPVLLPGNSHGRRSLVGYSPWGREELDTTKRLHFHFSLSCIGEGNGNSLQCSCLENPRDSGA